MAASRFLLPAAVGTSVLGGIIYYQSRQPEKSLPEQRRERNDAKRDAGITGAGVGQNAITGLHERGGPGSGVPTGNMDPDRKVKTTAKSRDELPDGGVGGGVGAGGANSRTTVDLSAKKATTEGGGGESTLAKASQGLQGMFGQGGASVADKEDSSKMKRFNDTKIHSNHGETPTKRFPPGEDTK